MASYFDDNDWRANSEENLRYFYEEFSASVRKQLLHKNLLAPQNVYDVLYPRTRENLLAKNVANITDLEENSKSIRDALIAKLVSENIDLDKISEDTRKSLLARNKIIQDAEKILNDSITFRKELLSKNIPDNGDLLKDSSSARDNNISKNTVNPNTERNIESNNEEFRINNISKNKPDGGDLLSDSKDFLQNNIAPNVPSGGDLLSDSKQFLQNNIAPNKPDGGDLLNDSKQFLQNNLAPNKPDGGDLLSDSEQFLQNNISANKPNGGDLLNDSKDFLKNNTSANVPDNGDLLRDSSQFLQNNVAPNKPDGGDLLKDSESYLQNNIAPNKPDGGDLLTDSASFLQKNIAPNKPDGGDLLNDSKQFLQNNISANKPDGGDLLNDSKSFLQNNVSANKPDTGDLLNDSAKYLQNNVSANKPDTGDLLNDSKSFLQNNVSANKPDGGDLLNDSKDFLQNNVSANKPTGGDLLADSAFYLQNNISANKPDGGDLLNDSKDFLQNNISANKPTGGDLLSDSEGFLQNNIAPNKPTGGDLLIDSAPYLQNNLAPNVPDNGDLLNDSSQYLQNNLAPNVPTGGDLLNDSQDYLQNNLAPNVPDNGDLLTDSQGYLKDNLAHNVPSGGDLLADSIPIRNNLVSNNAVNGVFDLNNFSKKFRDNNLSKNPPIEPLGVVVEGLGTAAFLGVSRVMVQGILLRQILLSKNKASKYSIDTTSDSSRKLLFSKNDFQLNSNEYGTSTANLTRMQYLGYHGKSVREEVESQLSQMVYYNRVISTDLQLKYGTSAVDTIIPAAVGGGFYATNTSSFKGGVFTNENAVKQLKFDVPVLGGTISDAIRNYNLSRNLYNLYKITPGDLQSLTPLQNNNDEGFQDLISKTIGHFRGNDSVGSQLQSNTTPRGILVSNEGAYIKGGSPEAQYRPQEAQGMPIGSPASMMAKTTLGNPLEDTEFQSGTKGVVHVIRTIKNSDAAKFTINYDVQNSRKYIIGVNTDGSPKVARQRFTVSNPYRPANAKKVQFYLQNYSSGQAFYFPPYIQDFSDSYGASWNSVQFLGRPEPVFTYNNSSREGSITFFVLTDYAQNLVIGRDFGSDSMSDVKINPRVHFTSQDASQNEQKKETIQQSEAQQKLTNQQKTNYIDFQSNGAPNKDVLNKEINNLQKESNAMQQNQEDLLTKTNNGNLYTETNPVIGNVNNFMTSLPGRNNGDIDTKAEASKKRIDQMIQNLAFQPAFFSGDKVDFLTKMDFLAKLTRPATADEGSGFSFSRPPVCHIHLGDWWSNDIVIDSVNFSYTDAPWTLDDGRTQPMWATVSMSFKFIGPYRGQQGGPVLSDDINGLYAPRGTSSQSIK